MDGSGTYADPYHIRTVADLQLLEGSGYSSYKGTTVYFSVENDIDFEGASFDSIGDSSNIFNGQFNGNNHVISNMTITSSTGNTGFFKYIGMRATVKNLRFKDCTVTDTSSTGYVGMLVGRIYGSYSVTISRIETDNCDIVASGPNAGGLTGYLGAAPYLTSGNQTYIYNCYVHDGYVTGSKYVGGLSGYGIYQSTATDLHPLTLESCTVARMYVKCPTTSTDNYVGGMVGYLGGNHNGCSFTNCKVVDSVVMNSGYSSGGLVCYSGSAMSVTYTGCSVDNTFVYSTGRISGGLIGWVYNTSTVTVTNCSVTRCTVRGSQQVGGIFGRLQENTSAANWTAVNPVVTNNFIGGTSTSTTAVAGLIGYRASGVAGTQSGGTQTTNNVVGAAGSYGVNITGYSDQTATAGTYITASGLTATVRGRRVAYSITRQRGAAIAYNSGNRVFSGMKWDYYGASGVKYNYNRWYKFPSAAAGNSYTSAVTVLNALNSSGTKVTLSSAITIGSRLFTSNHDRSFVRNASDMVELTEHDESLLGVI